MADSPCFICLTVYPGPYQQALPDMNPRDLGLFRQGSVTSAAMLDSESTFMRRFHFPLSLWNFSVIVIKILGNPSFCK